MDIFRLRRFPICYQLDAMDCGPSCLQMIARYHGRNFPKHFVAKLCEQDRQGASIATLARGAEKLGFRTLAVKVSFEELLEKAPLPCIAYWPQGHFVVVYRVRKDRVYIADPSAGLATYTALSLKPAGLRTAPSATGESSSCLSRLNSY